MNKCMRVRYQSDIGGVMSEKVFMIFVDSFEKIEIDKIL